MFVYAKLKATLSPAPSNGALDALQLEYQESSSRQRKHAYLMGPRATYALIDSVTARRVCTCTAMVHMCQSTVVRSEFTDPVAQVA